MLASRKFPRAVVLPLLRTARVKYTSPKYFSDRSGDDDGEENHNNIKDLCSCCICCSCGGEPPAGNYDARKYGHCLPQYNTCPPFEPLRSMPTDIFRPTVGERLGPQGQASKCCAYLNPEYFSYQHMSFYDLHLNLRQYRKPCPQSERKPL